jgi:hypothetical protein
MWQYGVDFTKLIHTKFPFTKSQNLCTVHKKPHDQKVARECWLNRNIFLLIGSDEERGITTWRAINHSDIDDLHSAAATKTCYDLPFNINRILIKYWRNFLSIFDLTICGPENREKLQITRKKHNFTLIMHKLVVLVFVLLEGNYA